MTGLIGISACAPSVWRCLSGSAVGRFPHRRGVNDIAVVAAATGKTPSAWRSDKLASATTRQNRAITNRAIKGVMIISASRALRSEAFGASLSARRYSNAGNGRSWDGESNPSTQRREGARVAVTGSFQSGPAGRVSVTSKCTAIAGMILENHGSHTLLGVARSSRVHRRAAGRDYAAPLQLNGNC